MIPYINMYYMDHGFYVLNPRQLRDDYQDMGDMGVDAVTIAVLEQYRSSHKDMLLHFDLAHKAGLKVNIIPARFAGLFSGAPKACSPFAMNNPDTLVRDSAGKTYDCCCTENPRVFEFFDEHLSKLLSTFDIDGVVLDEPKGTKIVCHCEHCRRAYGEQLSEQTRERSLVKFLDWVCTRIKSIKPKTIITIATMPRITHLLTDVAKIAAFDHLSIDGPISDQEWFPNYPLKKPKLFETAETLIRTAREHGKKGVLFLESFSVPQRAYAQFAAAWDEVMKFAPDGWALYYYPHNTEDVEQIMSVTRDAVRKLKSA